MTSSATARLADLKQVRGQAGALYAVHYACERLTSDAPAPPGVSAIAFQDVYSDESIVFSRVDRPKDQEEFVLTSYFDFLQAHQEARLVHFKMNAALFSFTVLRNRYAHVLKKEPLTLPSPARQFALDALIRELIDQEFADAPQLQNLIALNGLKTRSYLPGEEEADRFAKGDHTAIKKSLVEKVQLIAQLAKKFLDGDLETKNAGRRIRFGGESLDSLRVAINLAEAVRHASRPLVSRRKGKECLSFVDEYDFQDVYHALLRVFFSDVRAEDYVPSGAGSNSRIDFVLPEVGVAIEIKDAVNLDDASVGAQLAIDIQRYQKRAEVRQLLCLVFDLTQRLKNPAGLERDLTRREGALNITVRIITS